MSDSRIRPCMNASFPGTESIVSSKKGFCKARLLKSNPHLQPGYILSSNHILTSDRIVLSRQPIYPLTFYHAFEIAEVGEFSLPPVVEHQENKVAVPQQHRLVRSAPRRFNYIFCSFSGKLRRRTSIQKSCKHHV